MWLNNADRIDDEPIELFRVDNDTYISFAAKLRNLGVTIHTGVTTEVIERNDEHVRLKVGGAEFTEASFSEIGTGDSAPPRA